MAVRLWDGSRIALGDDPRPDLEIAVSGPEVLGSLLRRPTLERLLAGYTSGGLEIVGGDPIDLLDAFRERGSRSFRDVRKGRLVRAALPLLAAGRSRSLENAFRGGAHGDEPVSFHYDVSNDFYALFLDPEMQYSCGYFKDWENPLERAQQDKLEMICRKLRLAPGDRLLDIGCGWGGLVCYAALHYGASAHGVTTSEAQHAFAAARVRELGLEDRVTVELRDYLELTPERDGRYDKIASIGMVEHVGIANYPEYFSRIASLLRDRGLLLNHGITRSAKSRRRRRPEKQLMLRYVFPGHELDHVGHTLESLEMFGFEVRDVEDWREHYALTTRHWCKRLHARSEEAERFVGPARTRTWLAYLAGVSGAFRDGSLRIYQILASRHETKGPADLPPTREHLYPKNPEPLQPEKQAVRRGS